MKSSLWLAACALLGCKSPEVLPTVDSVDLNRYAGKWYEWARFDHSFERGCLCSTAEYTLQGDVVRVVNTCTEAPGKEKSTEGKAFPVPGTNNAQLKVQFFWPFKGDYYILALGEDYEYALVGAPNRKYLWILGRTAEPDVVTVEMLLAKAESLGFNTQEVLKINCSK
jgi:apolipoprotein D and lipocalin family protein